MPRECSRFSSVQMLSCVQLSVTPWAAAHQTCLSITNSQSLFKLTSIQSVMPSNHLILYCPLLLLPSIFPSIMVFSNESVLYQVEMATHSSVLAWRIPGTGEPGGMPSMGSHRVGHDWSDLAAAATRDLEFQLQHQSFQWIFRTDFL